MCCGRSEYNLPARLVFFGVHHELACVVEEKEVNIIYLPDSYFSVFIVSLHVLWKSEYNLPSGLVFFCVHHELACVVEEADVNITYLPDSYFSVFIMSLHVLWKRQE